MEDVSVIKIGGSSLATIEKILNIAKKLSLSKEKMVVIVSAMGKMTDELLSMVKLVNEDTNKREVDLLLTTGEQQSASLMSMALQKYQRSAIALTGYQARIKTRGIHQKSIIDSIDIDVIKDYLKSYDFIVVTGFQGVNSKNDLTTLGRGGSDTSAVAIAAKLKTTCKIYSDVVGIYGVDPNVCKGAKKLDEISYQEMLELALSGSKILEPRSVELAYEHQVPLYVGQFTNSQRGTWIKGEVDIMEKKKINGASLNRDVINISIKDFSNNLFDKLLENNIQVSLLRQEKEGVSFVVLKDDYKDVVDILNELEIQYESVDDIGCVTLVGLGFSTCPQLSLEVINLLNLNSVEVNYFANTDLSLSLIINENDITKVVELLAKKYDL